MTEWYVKELSQATKVSVRTLHHYDKIGLLKPSIRLANNYRLYSEKDLLKLQQILALKFFGFELARIKTLMEEEINIFDHFRAQQKFLAQKVQALQEASLTLEVILSESDTHKSVPWKTILKLIEDYQMTQELEHPWVAKVLNPEELKDYASFEQGLKSRFTAEDAEVSRQKWLDLVKEIEANLNKDPTSDFGVDMGKQCMDWVNATFTEKYATLRTILWEKGFKGGYSDVPPEVVSWLDKATDAYYKMRFYAILDRVRTHPSDVLLKQWEDLVTEICGNAQDLKDALYESIFTDDKVSPAAKEWLKQIKK